jgi:hypothetical protein
MEVGFRRSNLALILFVHYAFADQLKRRSHQNIYHANGTVQDYFRTNTYGDQKIVRHNRVRRHSLIMKAHIKATAAYIIYDFVFELSRNIRNFHNKNISMPHVRRCNDMWQNNTLNVVCLWDFFALLGLSRIRKEATILGLSSKIVGIILDARESSHFYSNDIFDRMTRRRSSNIKVAQAQDQTDCLE